MLFLLEHKALDDFETYRPGKVSGLGGKMRRRLPWDDVSSERYHGGEDKLFTL